MYLPSGEYMGVPSLPGLLVIFFAVRYRRRSPGERRCVACHECLARGGSFAAIRRRIGVGAEQFGGVDPRTERVSEVLRVERVER